MLRLLFVLSIAVVVRAADQTGSGAIAKIVKILKGMTAQLQKEGEEDEETYEKMGCWCETNDREKTKAIGDAEQRIRALNAAIEGYTAGSATLTQEIKRLREEIAKNEEAVNSGKALRAKQLAEFNAEEKDMLSSITSLKSAVTMMSKHSKGASLLQTGEGGVSVMVKVSNLLHRHHFLLAELVTPRQRRLIDSFASFVQQPRAAYVQQPAASGEVFGVLTTMKESFETNLQNSQKEETENSKSFEDLKKAKASELAAGKQALDEKKQQLANSDTKNAESKADLEDTEDALASDTKFLVDVKEKCANMDAEFEERKETRLAEIAAVTKATGFLTSDEAHELFAKTVAAASFVQRRAASARCQAGARFLQKAAQKSKSPQLAMLAAETLGKGCMGQGGTADTFKELKQVLQDMIDKLLKEKQEEIAKKDTCIAGFNSNDKNTQLQTKEREHQNAEVEDYTATVDQLTKDIAQLKTDIADAKTQMQRLSEDREIANADFHLIMADERATEKLLSMSLNMLKTFYTKAALLQTDARQPAFKSYQKNEQSGGVMGMMEGVIQESKKAQAEAQLAEEDSQTAYESFVKDTNDMINKKSQDIINKMDASAKAEGERVQHTEDRDQAQAQLDQLGLELHDLHIDCDYLMKNFDLRSEARDSEIEALKQGIAMFSGATFSAFLQNAR